MYRYATWFLGRIENTLDNNGFAVGNKLSLADVLLFFVLGETLDAAQAPDLPQYRREPWGSLERVNELLARYNCVLSTFNCVTGAYVAFCCVSADIPRCALAWRPCATIPMCRSGAPAAECSPFRLEIDYK